MKTIGFIGGGRITRIILQAFKNDGITFEKVVVADTNQEVLNSLKLKFPEITVTTSQLEAAVKNDVLFIALHPPVLLETVAKIRKDLLQDSIVVSLAPKHTLEKISSALGGFENIARMNPSASTIVNKGINPIAFSPDMKLKKKSELLELLKSLGSTPIVEESKMEAYAVISAMGHTYFFFQFQKLKELAISFGMDEKEAQITIAGMLTGTSQTLFNSGLPYNEVDGLVPVKPLAEVEETIKGFYDQYLTAIYTKIKP